MFSTMWGRLFIKNVILSDCAFTLKVRTSVLDRGERRKTCACSSWPPHWLQWRMPKIAIRLVYKKHQREWGALWMVWRLHVLRSASTKGQVDCCLRSTGWRVLLYFFLTDYTISALQVLRIKPYNSTALRNRLVVVTKPGEKGTFSSVADSL